MSSLDFRRRVTEACAVTNDVSSQSFYTYDLGICTFLINLLISKGGRSQLFSDALICLGLEYSQRPKSYSISQPVAATGLISHTKPDEELGMRISIAQCAIGGYLANLDR